MATLVGTNFDDTLQGGIEDDVIKGRGGNDRLISGDGADRVDGGYGDDFLIDADDDFTNTLAGGAGDDTVRGYGFDFLSGGEGLDILQLAFGNRGDDLEIDLSGALGEAVRMVNLGPTVTGITLSGFEAVGVACGPGDDLVRVGDAIGVVQGGDGDDTLIGGDRDDFFRAFDTSGSDIFDGGKGFDRVSYDRPATHPLTVPVQVSLLQQGQAQDTGNGLDILIGIEHVSGTRFGDTLNGDNKANWLWGQGGDDSLRGHGGADLLQVSTGDDTVSGGSGRDTLNVAGAGDGGLLISLDMQGLAQDTGQGLLTLTGIENISGSDFDDTLLGSRKGDVLTGAWGSDILNGDGGGDILYGDGQISVDTGWFGATGPIATWAQALDRAGDANGDDTLFGGFGADVIAGGFGADALWGDAGPDTFVFLSVADSELGAEDVVNDLSDAEDVIDLSAIDAKAATEADDAFVLVDHLTGVAGQAALVFESGVTRLLLDVDGAGSDFELVIVGNHLGFANFTL